MDDSSAAWPASCCSCSAAASCGWQHTAKWGTCRWRWNSWSMQMCACAAGKDCAKCARCSPAAVTAPVPAHPPCCAQCWPAVMGGVRSVAVACMCAQYAASACTQAHAGARLCVRMLQQAPESLTRMQLTSPCSTAMRSAVSESCVLCNQQAHEARVMSGKARLNATMPWRTTRHSKCAHKKSHARLHTAPGAVGGGTKQHSKCVWTHARNSPSGCAARPCCAEL